MVGHLLSVPAPADAEDEAAVGNEVKAGDFLGRGNWVALNHQTDAGAQLQVGGDGSGGGEGDEGVVGVPVHLGQVGPAGPGRDAAGGDVGMLRHPHGLEPPLLQRPRQFVGTHGVVGYKHHCANVHFLLL